MVIAFFQELEKKWNDQTGILTIDSQRFEIIEIAKTRDIPTVQGLAALLSTDNGRRFTILEISWCRQFNHRTQSLSTAAL